MADQASTISTSLVKAIEDQIQKLNDAGLYGQAASLYNNAQERFRFSHQQYSDFLKNQGLPQRSAAELADWSQSAGVTGNYGGQPMDMDAQRGWIQQNILGKPVQNVQMAPGTEPWRQYLDKNPDVKSAYTGYKQGGGNMSEAEFAAHHYNNYGRAEKRTWGDSRPYQVSAAPTAVQASGTGGQSGTATGSAAAGAANQGIAAGLTPSGMSAATQAYFAANPDVATAFQKNNYGLNADQFAQTHAARYGTAVEGRSYNGAAGRTASAATQAYFAANPDVAAAFQKDPMGMAADQYAQTHFNKYGVGEGRQNTGFAYTNPAPVNSRAPVIDQTRYTSRQSSGYGTTLPAYNNLGNVVLPPGQFGGARPGVTTSQPQPASSYGIPGMLDDSYMSTVTMLPNGTIQG